MIITPPLSCLLISTTFSAVSSVSTIIDINFYFAAMSRHGVNDSYFEDRKSINLPLYPSIFNSLHF